MMSTTPQVAASMAAKSTPTNSSDYASFLSILRRSTELLTDDPIREEIFSVERLEQYAAYLAEEFKVSPDDRSGNPLLSELKECGRQLRSTFLSLEETMRSKPAISPAAEWFLDNFHIVEEQLEGIKRDLPENYYHELPKLASGELAGYPRIYAMALAIIAHTDSRFDAETLKRFIQAFQRVSPLQIGELWAVAITLRIALIEHLTPLALRILSARQKRSEADLLADKILELTLHGKAQSHELVQMLSEELARPEDLNRAFIVQLTQRLRDQDPDVWPIFDWLENQLKHHDTNTVQVTQLEHHRQAAAQVTVGNIITSMRLLGALDWRDFFESVSCVDPILAQDPAAAYSKMDFSTRDSYRHAIERLAKYSGKNQLYIASRAIELASANSGEPLTRRAHVGYYLVGEGLEAFEKELQYKARFSESVSRFLLRHPTCVYLGSLCLLTVAALIPLFNYFFSMKGGKILALCFGAIALIPASELALSLLNHYITFFMAPKPLPKMDFDDGIPESEKTFVVIPTLFSNENAVKELLDAIQIHYLANQDANIYFALLGDFSDATSEALPSDGPLLEQALKGIQALNAMYGDARNKKFHLFLRRRKWNPSEGKWIGWERKRGKLLEFNALLRGALNTSYLQHLQSSADRELFLKIKNVITLDSDTKLPRSSAHRLIGTISHPLNRPYYSSVKERVTQGYGILQPRISVDWVSAAQTRFSKIFSGNTGLDPYTTAVSDVYQDLFAEGSFTGKGLYVVDTFERALKNRAPENSVLSHDLFEGSYARAALVTDVELFDDYPSHYEAFSKRQHRWTRGDWQIARWLLPNNNLSLISRWKIFDNLRRSLVAPTVFVWLLFAWTVLPGSPTVWTLPIIFLLSFPLYAPFTTASVLRRHGLSWWEHFKAGCTDALGKAQQIILTAAFLADQSWNQLDAILRTIYRKLISKKKLLEWMTFAQVEHFQKGRPHSLFGYLGVAPFLAVFTALGIFFLQPGAIWVASPFLLLWLGNSQLKKWLNQSPKISTLPLDASEVQTFRYYARRTWHFFETFVGEEDHWLAPDNFQEEPKPIVATRTSPTNIGLQLLSTASAFDFGYIGVLEFLERLEKTFSTLAKLEGLNGHFFNWYDTRTLEPLRPQYISTVDSGNLAGHLMALKQACLAIAGGTLVNENAIHGIADTFFVILQEARHIQDTSQGSAAVSLKHFFEVIEGAQANLLLHSPAGTDITGSVMPALMVALREAEDILDTLGAEEGALKFSNTKKWVKCAINQITGLQRDAGDLVTNDVQARLLKLAEKCDEMALKMDFGFLYDQERKIFVIGYNASEGKRDASYYDLLASESRLASFVAIAKGDVPLEHWFRLGRQMTAVNKSRSLIAWTATMFEYLMPLLVMQRYRGTLLDQTYQSVVARQIEYGNQHQVPWGISEAGYNARDLNLNYQYGPFGVPGLGLKRGLSDDLVISPYSTMLAAMIDPRSALANLKILESKGALSQYGFYESIDYTPQRLPENQKSFILRSFMAHHQGMSLVSLNNLLNHSIMQARFHAEPRVQATQLLLQESIPTAVPIAKPHAEEAHIAAPMRFAEALNPRFYSDVHVATPRTQILSNGNYSVMVTSAGSGYSKCGPLSVTRWREDWTRDHWGSFIYIRDRVSGKVWSTSYQPTTVKPETYEVVFAEDKVEFLRQDGDISTHTEIIVSPEDDVELRRVSLTNHSNETYDLEITSFMEVVLARATDDAAHPAFSNLFVQTEFVLSERTLLATRRKRSKNEAQSWGFHVVVAEGDVTTPVQYETDRSRFIGRGRSAFEPIVIKEGRPLSNTVGSVLDPAFSLRETLRIPAHSTAKLTFATGIAKSREEALRLADKYHDIHIFAREAGIAWTQSQVHLRHLNISSEKAHLYQRLAGRIIYSDPLLRPRSHLLAQNRKSQSSLWAYGISGDLPIILTRISDEKDMAMVRDLLHAHEYLRLKGLLVDLVILNERAPSYLQFLQEALQKQIRMSASQSLLDKPGGIFIRRTDIMPVEDVTLLKSVAKVTLSAEKGTLDEQLKRRPLENVPPKTLIPTAPNKKYPRSVLNTPVLKFFNGLGGFDPESLSYVIILREEQWTPAPWINVIANGMDFGFQVSESGAGYTWSVNSRENRLTSWSNDPVTDPVCETIYIRDEETGDYWTPTPLPIREPEPYVISHAQGCTRFDHTSHGIAQSLELFVPLDASVKISRLKLKNLSSETRKLSVTSFVEWVLGFQRGVTAPMIVTELDVSTGALFARNFYNNEFSQRVAFASISEGARSFTCDRKEFMGRNGSPARPAAMNNFSLSHRYGAGLDPCAALQTKFELEPGQEREFIFLLGDAPNAETARLYATHYRNKEKAEKAFQEMKSYWKEATGSIQIKTPDPAMNIMVNHWLLYQTLSCRVWARSAFYQSGGAFGFRDQLQDVMALIYSQPKIARDQILCATARQFVEGDVQHWWHPPTGRGVRTQFSDDLLWLPFVVSFYIKTTGDFSLLHEEVSFIEAPLLEEGQDDAYTHPKISNQKASIFEHCLRAIDRSLKLGQHGLPLMGSGDWNDGMNRVGHEGKGESVWVAWFLSSTMKSFIPICEKEGRLDRVESYGNHLKILKTSLEQNAWDGDWYKRAYFDDGSALGSASNQECRIDSIAQSWAVLSGVGDPKRCVAAMAAVDEYLIYRGDGLIKLFTPPFDRFDESSMDPGYIKGYVPGVRENGGQYTHAAIWTVMAFASLGEGDLAGELYALLNPINHSSTRAGVHKYKVEPYVVAADIYGFHPHTGRGGWTWYTGSASWMYRAAIESILGFDLRGNILRMKPCIPRSWREFEMTYKYGEGNKTEYRIRVIQPEGSEDKNKGHIKLDGVALNSQDIALKDDGISHDVEILLGS